MTRLSHERALWLSLHVLPYEAALRQWLRRYRHIDLDVDDVVQEAYARIAALDSFEDIRNPKNYLFQTAHSIIVSHLRHSRVVPIITLSDVDMVSLAVDELTPERQLAARDELQKIEEVLVTLPSACRDVFVLRRAEGLSQREVAAKLGLTESVVEHHMAKVIRLLMDAFGRGGKSTPHASTSVKTLSCLHYERSKPKPRN